MEREGRNQEKLLKSGDGWRIGWNPSAPEYPGLVGAETWAVELTAGEFHDFCRLLTQLTDTMSGMAAELMASERIACEVESELLWLEVEGFPHSYSLRLILHQGRCCEGNWSDGAAPELARAAQMLELF